jgi:hypothetical protein
VKRQYKRILMPVNSFRRMNNYYDYPAPNRISTEKEGRYKSWKDFKERLPFNAQLLIHLFGERDAIDCHHSMCVVSEVKAASLCSFFSSQPEPKHRLKRVSDS